MKNARPTLRQAACHKLLTAPVSLGCSTFGDAGLRRRFCGRSARCWNFVAEAELGNRAP